MKKNIYLPGLHGLRFIAATLVIITHVELFKAKWGLHNLYNYKLIADFGTIGVDFFFVLSGFLITFLLFKEKEQFGKISIGSFYLRRLLRIWPLYYFVLFLVFFLLPMIEYPEIPGLTIEDDFYSRLTLFSLFLPNISKAFYDFVPYGGVMWSVGVEEQFYLIWPLILSFSKKYFRNIVLVILILVIIKIIFTLPFLNTFENIVGIKKTLAMIRIEIMAIGALGAWLVFYKKHLMSKYLLNNFTQTISYLGLGIVIFFLPPMLDDAKHLFLGFIFILIILNISLNSNSFFKLENKYFRFLGNISFGMYMYHMIVAGGVITLVYPLGQMFHGNIFIMNVIIYLLIFGFTILISYLSYNYLEKPFLKIKGRFTKVSSGTKI